MRRYLFFFLLPILLVGCDGNTEEKVYDEERPVNTENEIILHSETSYWLSYEGIIPCSDCEGIRLELKLESNPDKITQTYEINETYLGTKDGDRKFRQAGQIEISYGISGEPNAFVINLLDENLNPTYRFIQETDGKLSMLGQDGLRISSAQNYQLDKK